MPWIFGLFVLMLGVAPAAASATTSDCDRLAASPTDREAQAEPVPSFLLAENAVAAVEACRSAIAEQGRAPRLEFQLGRALEANGDLEDAVAHYRESAEAEFAPALFALGALQPFELPKGLRSERLDLLIRAGRGGVDEAWVLLGRQMIRRFPHIPEGLQPDTTNGLTESAGRSAAAAFTLATLQLYSSRLVGADAQKARTSLVVGSIGLLLHAAGQSHYGASLALSKIFRDGLFGIPIDAKRAAGFHALYVKQLLGSDDRDPAVMFDLATYYESDRRREPEPSAAFDYLRRASALGYRPAVERMISLATSLVICAEGGCGGSGAVPPVARAWDVSQAKRWLVAQAEAGDTEAELSLATIFSLGSKPIPQDKAQFRYWLARAAEHGSDDAARILAVEQGTE